jgi:acetolactate synthase-1/2/3 large subunit
MLAGLEQLVLVGAAPPVAFFAYPGKEGWLTPAGCELLTLAEVGQDVPAALDALLTSAPSERAPQTVQPAKVSAPPGGTLTPETLAQSLGSLMPDNAVVVDEAVTCGFALFPVTRGAPPHDWLILTGGAIGEGLPLALGAALACPERKVIALEADGSAMYTIQSLWSMVRENANVTVVIMNNRSYAILNIELARVGAGAPNAKTLSMFDLSQPGLDFVALARGMGMSASRVATAEEFHRHFAAAMARPGPCLIDAMVVQ